MAADIVIMVLVIAYCIFLFVRHQKKKKDGTAGGCSGCPGCSGCSGCECKDSTLGGVPYSDIFKDV